jgi:hypothetical protein
LAGLVLGCGIVAGILRGFQLFKPGFKFFDELPVLLLEFNGGKILLVGALLVVECKEQGVDVELGKVLLAVE